jgi:hypothetical protein
MIVNLDTDRLEDYRIFLRIKALPRYRFIGHTAEFPDEYASLVGMDAPATADGAYRPIQRLFDYQSAVSKLAIRKRKFAAFIEPGYGKTLIGAEFARHSLDVLPRNRCALWLSPLMVVRQTIAELRRFYDEDLPIVQVPSKDLQRWLDSGDERFGITNYEALTEDIRPGRLGSIVADESSIMKSSYGVWGQNLIELGRGIPWKLCLTGTPAPNDRIEYASHAVFLDQYPTTNAFLARFFVNRGQTNERWELKSHALRPFYTSLSHWCFFMTNPSTYGFKDNAGTIPPIHVHIHDVDLTEEQRERVCEAGGNMFGLPGGITSRGKLSQLAKGRYQGKAVATNKPEYIRALVHSWPDESTLVWCIYNPEQESMERMFPEAGSISGDTPYDERERIIEDFQAARTRTLISKAKVLGFGLNLQVATRQVFSGLVDSYESYFQCVKRSNRVGSTKPLNVHLSVTPIEHAMIDTVLAKANRVEADTREQERIFKEVGIGF